VNDLRFDRVVHRQDRDDLERLGGDYGGWVVPTSLLSRDSICYLAGVGEDTTFDEALIERFGCQVFAFDPTPKAVRHGERVAESLPSFHFLAVGLAGSDGNRRFYPPADPSHASYSIDNLQKTTAAVSADCLSLTTLMRRLGHDRIDLLKLDIEGSEYEVLEALREARVEPTVICVEFHGPRSHQRTAMRELARSGYVACHRRERDFTFVGRATRDP
jgi:FkbM family methyltransferase